MIPLSPQLLISTAGSFVGTTHSAFTRSRHSAARGRRDADTGRAKKAVRPPWDVTFIQHCGYWSHYSYHGRTSSWPIPAMERAPDLAEFGHVEKILYETPEVGDIFLQYAPPQKTFVHVGIVLSVLWSGRYGPTAPYHDVYGVEGDVDRQGRLHGGRTLRVRRRLLPALGDRFLRWADLPLPDAGLTRRISQSAAMLRRVAR